MTRTRLALVLLAFLCVLLLVARETSSLRLNAHTTQMSRSQSSHWAVSNHDGGNGLGYDIKLLRNGRAWMEHRRVILGQPRIQIEGELKDVVYAGTDWMPLYKNFSMTYVCDFATPPSEEVGPSLQGSISGEIEIRITGFCSRREARRIAMNEAKKGIREYILKLNP